MKKIFILMLGLMLAVGLGCASKNNPSSPKTNPTNPTGPIDTPTDTSVPCTNALGYTCTPTFTSTITNSYTPSFTSTFTNSNTPAFTATQTLSPTFTISPTFSNTPSATPTDTNTITHTPLPTSTATFSSTSTQTLSPTSTGTPTFTSSSTATPTWTRTAISTSTNTSTQTSTSTNTLTVTATATATFLITSETFYNSFPTALGGIKRMTVNSAGTTLYIAPGTYGAGSPGYLGGGIFVYAKPGSGFFTTTISPVAHWFSSYTYSIFSVIASDQLDNIYTGDESTSDGNSTAGQLYELDPATGNQENAMSVPITSATDIVPGGSPGHEYFYVTSGSTVSSYRDDGSLITSWTVPGASNLAVSPITGHVYVSDTYNVYEYTNNGTLIASWGGPGNNGNGKFGGIVALAVNPITGNVFVGDVYDRIQQFSPNGVFLYQIGNTTVFFQLFAFCFDSSGNLYVGCQLTFNGNVYIQEFSY